DDSLTLTQSQSNATQQLSDLAPPKRITHHHVRQAHPYRHCLVRQVQAEKVQARVQKVVPRRAHGQAVYRGGRHLQDCLHLRRALHWLRYLPQEVPLWRHQHYQLAHQPRKGDDPPLFRQLFQASSVARPAPRPSLGTCRYQRYWQVDGIACACRQAQAQPWSLRQPSRMARYHQALPWFRTPKLFTKILEDNLKAIIKPQYVDNIPRMIKGTVNGLLTAKQERDNVDELIVALELSELMDREVSKLSGGELQRFAIAMACVQDAQIYMFDEPSSYLDVKQRLNAARTIRSLLGDDRYVIVVEHDLSVLDYLSDFVCVLYGMPSVYGVVTLPFSVREGINIFLDGKVPTENLRFRDESLTFRIADAQEDSFQDRIRRFTYPSMTKTQGNFHLSISGGSFTDSEILVMLGQNGTGKTTFIKMLAGILPADDGAEVPSSVCRTSRKPSRPSLRARCACCLSSVSAPPSCTRNSTRMCSSRSTLTTLSTKKCSTCRVVNCSVWPFVCAWASPPTFTLLTSLRHTSTRNNVSLPVKSSSASSCTPRRRPLSSSTISSWPRTLPIASLCTRVSPVPRLTPMPRSPWSRA
ncbi:hypothetical protein BCR44DRAFT_1009721, partial [Catenaria anguillulae PL171]